MDREPRSGEPVTPKLARAALSPPPSDSTRVRGKYSEPPEDLSDEDLLEHRARMRSST